MRKRQICWLLSLLLATACAPATPSAGPVMTPTPLTAWVTFVHVNGVTYDQATADIMVSDADIGPEIAKIHVRLDARLPPLPYQPRDGDALLIPVGTSVYGVKGYNPTFLVAVRLADTLALFQSQLPELQRGADLLPLAIPVHSVDITAGWPLSQPPVLATVTDPQQVMTLVDGIRTGFMDRRPDLPEGRRYGIVVHGTDGTSISCAYWVDRHTLCGRVLVQPAFDHAVADQLPHPLPAVPALTTYQGVTLPRPNVQRVLNDSVQLPPAWLRIGERAIPGTAAGYTVETEHASEHADPAAPPRLDDLAIVDMPARAPAVVIIGNYVSTFAARVGPWPTTPYDTQGQSLPAKQTLDRMGTAFTLAPIGTTDDQILLVAITFNNATVSGNINYIWHLNPAK